MTVVIDASAAVTLVADGGELGDWVAATVRRQPLSAPHLMYPEAANALRRQALRGELSADDAMYVALAELLDAPLVTLDRRLSRSHGPRCEFLRPPVRPPASG